MKAIDKLETVEDFEEAFKGLLADYQTSVKRVGEIVARAGKTLAHEDYVELLKRLNDLGWDESLLDAARDVYNGELDVRLVVSGVAVDEVRKLSKTGQNRLTSGEKFPLKQESGPPIWKRWVDMDADESHQLIGSGGSILTPREQHLPKRKCEKKRGGSYTTYTAARFDKHDGKFRFSCGDKEGKIAMDDLIRSLLETDELTDAYASFEAKMAEVQGCATTV